MLENHSATFLKQLAKGLAAQFGPDCEVAVHDLTKGMENTIVAIENGHVTGRHVGDGASEAVLKALRSKTPQDSLCYLTRTASGRVLRSSTMYVRDEQGKVIALFGINYDITSLTHAKSILTQLVSIPGQDGEKRQNGMDTIFSNVNDLLDRLIEESYEYINKPVAVMTKEDKIKAIHFLDEKGAFLIKKAGDKVSKFYDISKYTLYNYMNQETED
ncbi:MAG: helix-turn-helix transcriptional regulator [Oscillospiraceae bacterium]|nr:helix-turn-helix transcriptional regulator [Oscillospiraceae bacterium]